MNNFTRLVLESAGIAKLSVFGKQFASLFGKAIESKLSLEHINKETDLLEIHLKHGKATISITINDDGNVVYNASNDNASNTMELQMNPIIDETSSDKDINLFINELAKNVKT
jgi:hypothetical protein